MNTASLTNDLMSPRSRARTREGTLSTEIFKYLKVSIDTMRTRQLNLKLAENLAEAAERYAEENGYRNIQELAAESIREKIFAEGEYDESFTDKEIELIDDLIRESIKRGAVMSIEEFRKRHFGKSR